MAGLQAFLTDNPQTSAAVIVYAGARIKRLDEKIVAVPWSFVTG